MKKLISLIVIFLPMWVLADGLQARQAVVLSKFLVNKEAQKELFADNYGFGNLSFIEADDGGTEPTFALTTYKVAPSMVDIKCYYVSLDLDRPSNFTLTPQVGGRKKACLEFAGD